MGAGAVRRLTTIIGLSAATLAGGCAFSAASVYPSDAGSGTVLAATQRLQPGEYDTWGWEMGIRSYTFDEAVDWGYHANLIFQVVRPVYAFGGLGLGTDDIRWTGEGGLGLYFELADEGGHGGHFFGVFTEGGWSTINLSEEDDQDLDPLAGPFIRAGVHLCFYPLPC